MNKSDATLISSASNIKYITGCFNFPETERDAYIIKAKNKNYLITDKRYSEALRKKLSNIKIIDSGTTNFLTNELENFVKANGISLIRIEENDLTYSEYKHIRRYVKTTPADLKHLREIKKIEEIKNIKKACLIGDKAFYFVLGKLKTGITEKQIENELINFFIKNKVDYSFKPIVAFGNNSSIPHHETSTKKLKKNQIVLLDFGAKVNGYCSDMTRTLFFGKATEKFKKVYQTVLEAQVKSIDKISLNAKASKIDQEARNHILKNGFDNIIHSVGHGIGIEVHESPSISPKSKDTLKNDMVFSIEPGIYIPSYGGVRIEDLIHLKSGKPNLITKANKHLIEIN